MTMFNNVNNNPQHLDTLLENLEKRAQTNPDGASDLTLNQFIPGRKFG